MKKSIAVLSIVACLFFVGTSFAADRSPAFTWAYEQGLLQRDAELAWKAHLTRETIAPLLLQYISKVAKKDYSDRWCNAIDLDTADSHYRADLQKLCWYGVMLGYQKKLFPKRVLTNAQAVVLVMRIVDGFQKQGRWSQHWAMPYFERAKKLGFDGILPIYYQKEKLMNLENFITFLYSVEHPHQPLVQNTVIPWTRYQQGNNEWSTDILLQLLEIMKP